MQRIQEGIRRADVRHDARRRGSVLLLSAVMLVSVLAFVAFTVDVGYIALTKAQLQASADASVLASTAELGAGLSSGPTMNPDQVSLEAREAAVTVAGENRAGDVAAVYADGMRDVRLGQYRYSSLTGVWEKAWGVTPYNMVEVTLTRGNAYTIDGLLNTGGDRPLPLFFAPVIGHDTADITVRATSALLPGVGFRLLPGSSQTVMILPITLDEGSWSALLAGAGNDDFHYNPDTGAVTNGADGIREVNLYPEGTSVLPPGNRGTVDFGGSNNSNDDIKRQILYGLNVNDLAPFGGEIRFDNGPLLINGDTGISAGMKANLIAIKGQPRAIPIFIQVSGPGNNATYTITKLVGIRIVKVKLNGGQKHVIIQPAPFVAAEVIPGDVEITAESIFSSPVLISNEG